MGVETRLDDVTPRRHKLPAAMLFLIATGALSTLAYYFFCVKNDEEPEQVKTRGTANRNRSLDRQNAGESKRPGIHRRKVENAVAETLRRAQDRAEVLLKKDGREKLAWESYFLSESIKEMFSRNEFFERNRRFDSFRTALKAAEDARDKLIDGQREKMRRKEMTGAESSSYIKERYVRNTVESTLMIAWCAGGLVGKNRHESAQEAFCVSVSAEDVQDWGHFDQLLRKEREHCMADSWKHPGTAE